MLPGKEDLLRRLEVAQRRRRAIRLELDEIQGVIAGILDELDTYEPTCAHGRELKNGCFDCRAGRE